MAGFEFARRQLAGHGFIRLIPDAHHKPPVLRPLVDSDDELDFIARFEGLTNQRLMAERGDMAGIDPRELAFRARERSLKTYGSTCVNAAFSHTRPEGNRFNTGERGAWYCAEDVLTAVEEVAFHRTRELQNTGWLHDDVLYRAYHCNLTGDLYDLTGTSHTSLDPDPAVGYAAGQKLAKELFDAGEIGLVYPSVRRPGGTCAVVFVPQAVENVTPGATWRMVWEGRPEYRVEGS